MTNRSSDEPERWLPVVDWEGLYEVSDLGRVRSLSREIHTRAGQRYWYAGKLLKPSLVNKWGYMNVCLSDVSHGRRRTPKLHAVVLRAFAGPPPAGTEACHKDGNPRNNRLDNLRWDTRSANRLDAVAHGTHYWAAKQTCPRGHRLAAPNLVTSRLPARACHACCIAASQKWAVEHSGRGTIDVQDYADRAYRKIMAKAPPQT